MVMFDLTHWIPRIRLIKFIYLHRSWPVLYCGLNPTSDLDQVHNDKIALISDSSTSLPRDIERILVSIYSSVPPTRISQKKCPYLIILMLYPF